MFVAELRPVEPIIGKLASTIGEVLPAEDAQAQHLLWHELGIEALIEMPSRRLQEIVLVTMLHEVVHENMLGPSPVISHPRSSSQDSVQSVDR